MLIGLFPSPQRRSGFNTKFSFSHRLLVRNTEINHRRWTVTYVCLFANLKWQSGMLPKTKCSYLTFLWIISQLPWSTKRHSLRLAFRKPSCHRQMKIPKNFVRKKHKLKNREELKTKGGIEQEITARELKDFTEKHPTQYTSYLLYWLCLPYCVMERLLYTASCSNH